jgi:hypothetical protein
MNFILLRRQGSGGAIRAGLAQGRPIVRFHTEPVRPKGEESSTGISADLRETRANLIGDGA